MRSAREGKTIGQLIEETLVERDEANRQRALAIAEKSRTHAAETMRGMSDDEIEAWVVEQTSARPAGVA
jgi:hypothetical protein